MSDICSKCGFDMDAQFEARARLIDKLEAYEKGCANLESEIAHLRQDNAELKAELDLVRKECRAMLVRIRMDGLIVDHSISVEALKRITNPVKNNPQPTQDPTTAIAYGLYPSSARPVNPSSEPKCACPSVACPVHGLPPGKACGGW